MGHAHQRKYYRTTIQLLYRRGGKHAYLKKSPLNPTVFGCCISSTTSERIVSRGGTISGAASKAVVSVVVGVVGVGTSEAPTRRASFPSKGDIKYDDNNSLRSLGELVWVPS